MNCLGQRNPLRLRTDDASETRRAGGRRRGVGTAWRAALSGVVCGGWLLVSPAASAQWTIDFSSDLGPISVDPGNGNWPGDLTFPRFDAGANGTLTGIHLTLTLELRTALGLENTTLGTGATVQYGLPLATSFTFPDAQSGNLDLTVSQSVALGGYDGVTDYSGSSGITYAGLAMLTASDSVGLTVPVGSWASYQGTGNVIVQLAPLLGIETVTTGAGKTLSYVQESVLVAHLDGQYVFDPIPEASGWVGGIGLVGITGLWRWARVARRSRRA